MEGAFGDGVTGFRKSKASVGLDMGGVPGADDGKPGEALSFLLRARPFPAVLSLWAGNAVAHAALFPSDLFF
jgi:hypothetical protein